MEKNLLRQIAVIATTVVTLAVNFLSNALPFNNQTTAEISDRFDDLFTPAGYVFAIWGLIYIGMIAFTIFHTLTSSRWYPRMQRIGWLYVLSGALNCLWLLCWHYNLFPLSLVVMAALLLTLIVIYVRLDIGGVTPKPLERWTVDIPFSIYLGWISVATIANATDVLVNAGFDGGAAAPAWAIGVIVVAVVLGALMFLIRTDAAFLFVLAWALRGVAVSEAGAPAVSIAANVAAAVAVFLAAASIAWRLRMRSRAPRRV